MGENDEKVSGDNLKKKSLNFLNSLIKEGCYNSRVNS